MTLLQFALWHRFFVESVTPTLPEVTDPLTLLSHQIRDTTDCNANDSPFARRRTLGARTMQPLYSTRLG